MISKAFDVLLRAAAFALLLAAGCAAVDTSADTALSQDTASTGAPVLSGEVATSAEKVIVYYLHGTKRCPTCQKLEAYANEVVTTSFAQELASGAMEWQSLDVMLPENQHFVSDFQLVSQSVVLVRERGGAIVAWKNLPEIWNLVHDKNAYVAYVTQEIRSFLAGAPQ